MRNEFESKNALISYFDLLGFSNYVKSNTDNCISFYDCINNALNNFSDFLSPKSDDKAIITASNITKKYLRLCIASDSIVFCLDINGLRQEENILEEIVIWRYLSLTSYLIQKLFSHTELLIRGSIKIGDIFIKKLSAFEGNLFLYSNTHCENVYIEEKIANTPRIIISDLIVDKLKVYDSLLYCNDTSHSLLELV